MVQIHDITGETLWRVEMPNFVAGVSTIKGRIIVTAPILNRFLNQPVKNLIRWAESKGGQVEIMRQGWKG